VCDNPDLQRAFNQFHNNLHAVSPSGIGPAAPGLHNFKAQTSRLAAANPAPRWPHRNNAR
jgi:hypothetical protein